jgi:hypothetical protein
MCEGYTDLAPLVAIFCTNMAVEKKSRRLLLNTSSCSRLTFNALLFFTLNFIFFCVVLWKCHVVVLWTLQTLFVISVASLWLTNINEILRASFESVLCLFWCEVGKPRHVMGSTQGVLCLREDLKKWSNVKNKSFTLGVTMIWREPKNHGDDCYFAVAMLRVTTLEIRKLSYTRPKIP